MQIFFLLPSIYQFYNFRCTYYVFSNRSPSFQHVFINLSLSNDLLGLTLNWLQLDTTPFAYRNFSVAGHFSAGEQPAGLYGI